jgi:hypothetical protein
MGGQQALMRCSVTAVEAFSLFFYVLYPYFGTCFVHIRTSISGNRKHDQHFEAKESVIRT